MIAAFADCHKKGLRPEDYEAPGWAKALEALRSGHGDPNVIAKFDMSLTLDTLRYVSDLRIGRANPNPVPFAVSDGHASYDLAQFVAKKVAPETNFPSLLDDIEPNYNAYRRTEGALQAYIGFAAKDQQSPLPLVSKPLYSGDTYTGMQHLTQRLQLIRDQPAGAAQPVNNELYNGAAFRGSSIFRVAMD